MAYKKLTVPSIMNPDLQLFSQMQIVISSVWSSCSLQFHLDKTRVNIFTWVLRALVLSLSPIPPLFTLLHSSNPWELLESSRFVKSWVKDKECVYLFILVYILKKYKNTNNMVKLNYLIIFEILNVYLYIYISVFPIH